MAVVEQSVATVQRRRWTRDEYERFGDLGILGPDERVELIDGEVIQMPHSTRRTPPECAWPRMRCDWSSLRDSTFAPNCPWRLANTPSPSPTWR
jgi:hypothetical protein